MATVMATKEQSKEAVLKQPKRRIVRSRKRNGMRKSLLLAAAMALILGYVGMYAQVTNAGYQRAALLSELRNQRIENEALLVEYRNLTDPKRLQAAAESADMQLGTEISYISSPDPVAVAKADGEK